MGTDQREGDHGKPTPKKQEEPCCTSLLCHESGRALIAVAQWLPQGYWTRGVSMEPFSLRFSATASRDPVLNLRQLHR